MKQALWIVFQSAIVGGFYWLWYSTNGFDAGRKESTGAILFLGFIIAALVTGILSRLIDWWLTPRHLRRRQADDVPLGIPHWRRGSWKIQDRIAGSVEFRRAIEGGHRKVDK